MISDAPACCSDWDAQLLASGMPAVFFPDRDGLLRFDADFTRDCHVRAPADPTFAPAAILLVDRDTGYVNVVLSTSPTLLAAHPRADVRAFSSWREALEARAAYGRPPIAKVRP